MDPQTGPRRSGAGALNGHGDVLELDGPLREATASEIRRELARRARGLPRLLERRARLRDQLDELDREIALLGRFAEEQGRPPIADALAEIVPLEHVISATTAADLLRETKGFREPRATLTETITLALSGDERFQKVGAGQYERVA